MTPVRMTQERHQQQYAFQNTLKNLFSGYYLPIYVIIYFIRISVC